MKVHLIKDELEKYASFLEKQTLFPQAYLWEALKHFDDHWDIEVLDFYNMVDQSFQSKLSQRLWKREHYFPKEMILRLIEIEKETMRSIFRDLVNEDKDLNLRVNRFIHHIDQMLQIVQRKDSKASTHYHSDLKFVFVYLSFCFPENYTLYDSSNFLEFLKKVEARNIPRNHNPILFRNLMKATKKIMLENEAFQNQRTRLASEFDFSSEYDNLWVFDFYNFVATGKGKHQDL